MATITSRMLDAGTGEPIDLASEVWQGVERAELSERVKAAFLHGPQYLYVYLEGLEQDEGVELVLDIPGRGEWVFWLGRGQDVDIRLPAKAMLMPEFAVEAAQDAVLLRTAHLHLAPQGVLAGTPVEGEEWGLSLRVFPKGIPVPTAWLDEGSKLGFAGGRPKRAIALKDKEPVEWGIGQNLVRLDFGSRIPEGAAAEVQPEELFIPKRSKDVSYVRGRIAKGGRYRVMVEVPPLPLPEAEEGAEEEEEAAGSAEEEGVAVAAGVAAPTETRYLACLSFFVRGVWGEVERMERHVEEQAENLGDAAAEADEAVGAFRSSLAAAERFRTAQAKGVLKAETLAAVDRAFFSVLERVRGASAGGVPPELCSPYPENADFRKGLLAVASDEERAAKAVERARSLGADFIMVALESGTEVARPSDLLVIGGRLKGHFNRVLEFEAEDAVFRALVDPSGPVEALPSHIAGVRAVTGDVRYWHDCLASGHRLSYISVDEGVGETEGVPFIHVAAEKEPGAIVRAMSEGAFYVRTHPSPEIAGMEVEGRTLKVRRAEVSGICQLVLIGRDGPLALSPTGTAEYQLKGSEQFVRVQVLAGTTKVGERQVDLTTILNPVYPAEWVAPWLDEIAEEEVVEDEEDLPPEG